METVLLLFTWLVLTPTVSSPSEVEGRVEAEVSRALEARGSRLHARPSYRPNDPSRPTVCLIHGLNSSSGVFQHWFSVLEQAGYGVLVHDYPDDQALERSCHEFEEQWASFREQQGEHARWSIVAHSMGALLARWLVESETGKGADVERLLLIAPVNGGSPLASGQSLVQLIERSMEVVNKAGNGQAVRQDFARAWASRPLGESAADLRPGSRFLRRLNARSRARGVGYHILAGNRGLINLTARRRVEAQVRLVQADRGVFGGLGRLMLGETGPVLDALTDETGDGCVAVAATKLTGVEDHQILAANHLELIRAPLLFPDPGPIAAWTWAKARLPVPGRPKPDGE